MLLGFRVSFVAVRGAGLQEVLDAFGMRSMGEVPTIGDPGWYGTTRDGWAIVMASGTQNYGDLEQGWAIDLSAGREVWHLWSTDTSMFNHLGVWVDGELAWAVDYSGAEGPGEPEVVGEAPAVVAECIAATARRQAAADRNVDYRYDTVHQITMATFRFRYEGPDPGPGDPPYSMLERIVQTR